jgi:hypothetical protein
MLPVTTNCQYMRILLLAADSTSLTQPGSATDTGAISSGDHTPLRRPALNSGGSDLPDEVGMKRILRQRIGPPAEHDEVRDIKERRQLVSFLRHES